MPNTMSVKNILTKLLREHHITPYAFWKALDIGQNTAYRLCNDPDSIPSKKIMDKIHEIYHWLPGDYLVSDLDWTLWLNSLSSTERQEILDVATSYSRKTADGRIKKNLSSQLISFSDLVA